MIILVLLEGFDMHEHTTFERNLSCKKRQHNAIKLPKKGKKKGGPSPL